VTAQPVSSAVPDSSPWWHGLVGASVLPVAVVAGTLAAAWAMSRGSAPAAVVFPITLVGIAWVLAFERILPYRREWNRSQGDVGVDSLYLLTHFGVGRMVTPLTASLGVAWGGWLSQTAGLGLWPGAWPIWSQVVLAVVVREFFDYWGHRAMHRFDWLWRLHATHHSARRLYWLNGARAHPGEIILRFGVVTVLPLALLGVSVPVLALASVASSLADSFQHANIDLRLGPLSWVYSVGDLHRWHHSCDRHEADSNYGNAYIFWDAVFGTRYLPSDRLPPARVGIDGLDAFPRRFWAQWISPFRWTRILRDSAGASPIR